VDIATGKSSRIESVSRVVSWVFLVIDPNVFEMTEKN